MNILRMRKNNFHSHNPLPSPALDTQRVNILKSYSEIQQIEKQTSLRLKFSIQSAAARPSTSKHYQMCIYVYIYKKTSFNPKLLFQHKVLEKFYK